MIDKHTRKINGIFIDAKFNRYYHEFNAFELDKILRNTVKTMLNMIQIDSEILLFGFNNNDDAF